MCVCACDECVCDVYPVQRREVEEVDRRLGVLQCQWQDESLSHPVKEGMSRLAHGEGHITGTHTRTHTHTHPFLFILYLLFLLHIYLLFLFFQPLQKETQL